MLEDRGGTMPPPVSSPSGRGRGEGQAERLWCLECHSLRSDWASCQRRGEVVVTAPPRAPEPRALPRPEATPSPLASRARE
jgi:hypothetical protein